MIMITSCLCCGYSTITVVCTVCADDIQVRVLMYMCMYDTISPVLFLVGLKTEEDTVTEDLGPGNEH